MSARLALDCYHRPGILPGFGLLGAAMDNYWLRLAAVCAVGTGMLGGLWGVFRLMHVKRRAPARGDEAE